MSWGQGQAVSESQVIFTDFSLGSASTAFSLSYDQVSVHSGGAATGFQPGMRFSASGVDVNGCAAANNGTPGWYDDGCVGPSLFAEELGWVINSAYQKLDWFDFNIIRLSAFYD